ncbi:hypothetical protein LBC_07600 [Campylobacter sp. 19-13652]|nr:hypothetical protein LBC_07600 [Campylobacter sp. 19-13652]
MQAPLILELIATQSGVLPLPPRVRFPMLMVGSGGGVCFLFRDFFIITPKAHNIESGKSKIASNFHKILGE